METPSVITCNRQQLMVIRNALDLYARTYLGQLPLHHLGMPYNKNLAIENVFKAIYLPDDFDSNSSWGVMSPEVPDIARQAFDIHDVIREAVDHKYNAVCKKDNPEHEGYYVRPFFRHSNEEEPPTVVVGDIIDPPKTKKRKKKL